jgi:regulator of protease activity HflC (stomatin/prohibitin superfamily)
LYKEIGLDYESRIIQPAVQEVVKASTAQFTAEELITKRSAVKERIDAGLKDRLLQRGIIMETTSITNFDFSAEFNKAIESKVTAEQNALQAQNVVKMKEFEAQQAIATANGQAESTKKVADATAYAKKAVADADAYGLRVVREELSKDNSLIQYRQVEKWDGKLSVYSMSSGATPLIQLPVSQ